MSIVLEPRSCPRFVDGISFDPEPNWNFSNLVSEIASVEKKLDVFTSFDKKTSLQSNKGFVMRVSDDQEEESDDDDDDRQICEPKSSFLMSLAEFDVIKNHQSEVKEDIKNLVSVVKAETLHEIETYRSAVARVEKYRETRKDVERKLDLQYQRKVVEALDTYLSKVQSEHEIRLQIEERKIKSEEKAVQEEKIRQEKARQEEEKIRQEKARQEAKIRDEEAKKEAERKQVAEQKFVEVRVNVALTLEKHRLQKLEELEAMNNSLKSRSNKEFSSFENHIARVIRQINGTEDNAYAKIDEIFKMFKDPSCPVSISIETFAKKMTLPNPFPFARSYIIVYVTSQFPQVMDVLLAQFHKYCSYTIPKHNSESSLVQDDDSDAYKSIDSIMRLYGALVQTDIRGGTNTHGIEHGWAWLARFLNEISVYNRATATALNAFLQSAGFGLHLKYKSQFLKLVNVVRDHFLVKLNANKDSFDLQTVIAEITTYLDDQMYLKEPQGRTMQTVNLLSKEELQNL